VSSNGWAGASELLTVTGNEAGLTCCQELSQYFRERTSSLHTDETLMVVVVMMVMMMMMTHARTNPVSHFKHLRFVITHSFTFTISFASVTFPDTVATDGLRMISLFTQSNLITVPLAISVIA
jgi:hypothetical protein